MSRFTSKKPTKKRLILSAVTLLLITVALLGALFSFNTIQELLTRASYEPANIVVSVNSNLGMLPKPWRNLAQGGEDHEWRLQPLAGQVKKLKPEYIRLDHVFDFYDIVSGSPGNVQMDYSKIDPLLDDIIATGAKPYISLSYMPAAIASSDLVSTPQRYEDWQFICQQLIQHISGTRGISDVYYEVWNEPDLFGGWKYGGKKNYLTLYTYAARGAANARGVQPFKIGGPATTALYKNWFDALAKHVIENNLRLDFFSWHRYHTDVDQYRKDMTEVKAWIQQYPQLEPTLEFHITEWGPDSENNAVYDGNYSGAHAVATSIEMIGTIQRAFLFEIQDGKSPEGKEYWGRWGLFTHKDFGAKAKPRYRALQILERLGEERLVLLGKGTFVKAVASRFIDTGVVTIVLANFDPWGRNIESVPVSLLDLEPGLYNVTTTFLTKSPITQKLSVEEGALKFTVPMVAQEVAAVEISPAQ
jgi:xylan 1,4-beta-xylosidase